MGGVELLRIVNLVPGHSEGHHHICHGMGSWEHILNLDAGIDIPLRHTVVFHDLQLLVLQRPVLTNVLHYLEGGLVFDALENQIVHNVITGGNNLTHGGNSAPYIILCVVKPYIGAV